ncbi:pyrimidine-nucleoside phosphorylase [Xylocopilactobacillus apicola]|uniref:Pyrimidine-nucleoside phosphorylase n=1 Tax=Xylocopilactobacillus apicola TaxID=2932184 RepID=A0AAU9DDV5_9LACO|nr:pyrimidine-nucleoside phosphorylase [Xylocopilactobacillus apicola]BDR58005.1 pyrimidine-nucleoside phosphorylase [Xylocopilactobacillus apicola]
MRMVDVIHKKRNGGELTDKEIDFFVSGFVDGSIPAYQISALLMAIYYKNMTDRERTNLTMKMLNSGERLDLSAIPGIKVDKHSTGGIGDKVSIPLAPIVAAAGIPDPMISGRGLGNTGGTLDKLEAIPGYQVEQTKEQFIEQVKDIGLAIVGTTGNIAPADKKIYALRDVTDTVDSIPLISSSIMSKKIASGTDALVIDVKTGSGAFMKTLAEAQELAHALVEIGRGVGMKCIAVITDMSQPLGNKVGNSLEIEESIDLLKGEGPEDLKEITLTLGSYMAILGQKATNFNEAYAMLEKTIEDGSALEKFRAMLKAQGADERVIDDYSIMPQAKYHIELPAKQSGLLTKLSADEVGIASMMLGGGRQRVDDQLDYSVGIDLHKKVGDPVQEGESLMTIYSNREDIDDVLELLYDHLEIGTEVNPPKMIYEIIE